MAIKALFVGGFQKFGQSGHTGGQTFACTSLVESEWGKAVEWTLIDSTSETNDRRSIFVRMSKALRRLLKFWWLVHRQPIDVVLIFCSSGFSFVEKGLMARMAKSRGKPVIFAPRSGLIMNDIGRSEWMKKYVRNTVRKVDRLICQGESWKDYYQSLSGEPDEKFLVIHNWILPDPYLRHIPDLSDRSMNGTLRVLFLGWVTTNKGVFDLLDVAEQIREYPIQITIGGKGTHFEEIRDQIRQRNLEDIVKLPGWITGKDKLDALRDSDVFTLPSYREGYPNALLEAMASGLPCVTTAISSIPDLISHEKNGFLVKPGESDQLASWFIRLYEDATLRAEVGRAARERILSNNTLENATRILGRAFSELTQTKHEDN